MSDRHDLIIDTIADIRARNNKNWMALLKLAFRYAPEEATSIMDDIVKCDQEITELTKDLTVV